MSNIQSLWERNKVFIIGVIVAISMELIAYLNTNLEKPLTVGLIASGIITAAGSWAAKNLRGKSLSISGILLSSAWVIVPALTNHTAIDWGSVYKSAVPQMGVLISFFALGPFKLSSYEHNAAIVEAKKEPPVNQVPIDETKIST